MLYYFYCSQHVNLYGAEGLSSNKHMHLLTHSPNNFKPKYFIHVSEPNMPCLEHNKKSFYAEAFTSNDFNKTKGEEDF